MLYKGTHAPTLIIGEVEFCIVYCVCVLYFIWALDHDRFLRLITLLVVYIVVCVCVCAVSYTHLDVYKRQLIIIRIVL